MNGIEFLPQGDAAEPADQPRPGPPRRHLTWVVVVVACVAVSVWVATRPSGTSGSPGPNAVVDQPAASVSASVAPGARFGHRIVLCQFGAPVNTEVAQAMLRYLPRMRLNNTKAYRCIRGTGADQRIVSESVNGEYRGLLIQVDLTSRRADPPPSFLGTAATGHPTVALGEVEFSSAAITTVIHVRGRRGSAVPITQLTDLASFLSLNIVL